LNPVRQTYCLAQSHKPLFYLFFQFNGVNEPVAWNKNRRRVILKSQNLRIVWLENMFFFTKKPIYNPFFTSKHLENTLGTLLNKYMTSKDMKNAQNSKLTRNKNLFKLKYVFLGVFKVKIKYLILIILVIWNLLTQKSIVLVVKIFPNDNFLSL